MHGFWACAGDDRKFPTRNKPSLFSLLHSGPVTRHLKDKCAVRTPRRGYVSHLRLVVDGQYHLIHTSILQRLQQLLEISTIQFQADCLTKFRQTGDAMPALVAVSCMGLE